VLILGSAKDQASADPLVEEVSTRAVSLAGQTTLREAAALLRYGRVVVGVDAGLMHLAAAQDKSIVVIMGGGHFGRFFPYTSTTEIVTKEMACLNCKWACLFESAHCVSVVTPEDVVKAVTKALGQEEQSYRAPTRPTIPTFALSLLG
jgi:ADP-heptose:LPS heptosyltransferase